MAHFEIQDLTFTYPTAGGRPSLTDVSLSIAPGEYVVLCGRSGSGKTTLLRHLKTVLTPQGKRSGRVLFCGKPLGEVTPEEQASRIGYVMQNPNQMISKTMIFDEVALSLRNTGLDEAKVRDRVEETLKICGLYPFRNWPISALSFGQKKRVTIASVLVQNPELIILDEPTAGQDFHHYTEIMEFLRKLNEEGVTVVMITHDMHLMLEYTPRALVFSEGRLIADRSAAAVLCDRADFDKNKPVCFVDESGNLLYAQELTLPVVSENTAADAPEATQQPDLPSDAAGGEQGDGEPLQP